MQVYIVEPKLQPEANYEANALFVGHHDTVLYGSARGYLFAWDKTSSQSCDGRKLVANVDHKEGSTLHLWLIDPADPITADDPLASINMDLVCEGLTSVDRKGCKYIMSYPVRVDSLSPLN